MITGNSEEKLLPDTALSDPDQDKLGYDEFSSHLANTLSSRIPTDGFTIGLYGEWGSEKSTILNFTEEHLQEKENENSSIVVRFNPWWFSDQTDLITKFFDQLIAELEAEGRFDNLRENLSKLSTALSTIPWSVISGIPAIDKILSKTGEALQPGDKSIGDLKEVIANELEKSDDKIIVMIDDIDRLTKGEIKQIFRLVKSVGDFPNIAYILSFDQEIVIRSLKDEQGSQSGKEYLEKIIQLPLHIPTPEEGALESLFTDQVTQIVDGDSVSFDKDRWTGMLKNGVLPLLETPRDVARLSNSIDMMYNTIGEEVNIVDLVGIESLRVFYEEIYEEIRNHSDRFIGRNQPLSHSQDDDYSDLFISVEIDYKQEAVESILSHLFLRVKDSLSSVTTLTDDYGEYRKTKRILHPERYAFYFRLSVPRGEIPSRRMDELLTMIGDVTEFSEELKCLSEQEGRNGQTKAQTFLKRLSDHLDDISIELEINVIKSFYLVGDDLMKNDRSGVFDIDASQSMALIIRKILEGQEEKARFEIIRDSISIANSLYLSVNIVNFSQRQYEEDDEKTDYLFTESHTEELKQLSVERIEQFARDGKLLDAYNLWIILKRWNEWSDSDYLKEWGSDVTESDGDLIRFLARFDKAPTFDPRWLDPFLDKQVVQSRLQNIEINDLGEKEKEAANDFKKGMQLLADDKDPSAVEVWRHN